MRMKIVDFLKEAYSEYLEILGESRYIGMCFCLRLVSYRHTPRSTLIEHGNITYKQLNDAIPEFDPAYLKADDPQASPYSLWWDLHNTESRKAAFEKLIALYSTDEKKDLVITYHE